MQENYALSEKVRQFLSQPNLITPFLVIDLDCIAQQFYTLQNFLPDTEIYYTVAANPELAVLQRFVELGAKFSTTSVFEVQRCFGASAAPQTLTYSVQTGQGVAQAYAMGVRQFTFSDRPQLERIAVDAPASHVYCRVTIPVREDLPHVAMIARTDIAERSSVETVGRSLEKAQALLQDSLKLGLQPRGISLEIAAMLPDQRQIKTIIQAIAKHFDPKPPKIILELGQALVANAGVLQSEVVLIVYPSTENQERWIYLDVGKLGEQPESYRKMLFYPIRTPQDGGAVGPVVLVGATAEAIPRAHRHLGYQLPLSLQVGDRIEIFSAGAYGHTDAATSLHGFPPVKIYCV
jgi:ornithine decarboxylase